MLGLSAAFNTVIYHILINCLVSRGDQTQRTVNQTSSTCGMLQEMCIFLIYCAGIIAITQRPGLEVQSYAEDDTQLKFCTSMQTVQQWTLDSKVQQLVACIEEVNKWMYANRLKLNKHKTQFMWLGTLLQFFTLQTVLLHCRTRGVTIQLSTQAIFLECCSTVY